MFIHKQISLLYYYLFLNALNKLVVHVPGVSTIPPSHPEKKIPTTQYNVTPKRFTVRIFLEYLKNITPIPKKQASILNKMLIHKIPTL